MIKFAANCRDGALHTRYTPQGHLDLASQRYLRQVAGLMRSMVSGESEKEVMAKTRATAGYSFASRCIWKLDSEA